ncbi:MAG: dTMP kinase [Gammaproteobacteria bacterium]
MSNKFIVVEGSEGVGKSSQIKIIERYLINNKIDYILTREPGGTSFGESIRDIILNDDNNTEELTDSLLFYASRYENYKKIILPALDAGKTVVCDRYHYSTLVYQGIVGNNSYVKAIHEIFDAIYSKMIDHIIYLYTTPKESFKRISKRSVTDKFESRGLSYLEDLSNAYELVFNGMKNITKIDTSEDKDITKDNLIKSLDKIFKKK